MILAILKGFAGVLQGCWILIKIPFICLCICLSIFLIACGFYIFWWTKIKHVSPIKALNNIRIKQDNMLVRLFIQAPKQFVYDRLTRPAYFFPRQGLIIFEGRQGNGKTSSLVHELNLIRKKHPYAEILSNFDYKYQNQSLEHWKQLIHYQNSTDKQAGVVCAIDELQNWFSSKDSKNFDPQMLSIITQNRKNRRLILGTAQQFYMLSKDIRTQCTEVRHCTTLLGCITIVHRKEPIVDSEGQVTEWKNKGFYFWIHNIAERESYDTWKCIERLDKKGFERRQDTTFISNTAVINDVQKK